MVLSQMDPAKALFKELALSTPPRSREPHQEAIRRAEQAVAGLDHSYLYVAPFCRTIVVLTPQ